GKIVTRRHALDGVPVFVHVEDAASDRHAVERIDPPFPIRMEDRRPHRVANRSKTLPAAEIVNAIHRFTSSGNARRFAKPSRRATPIMDSLVTMSTSLSSGQPMVWGGCNGSTM